MVGRGRRWTVATVTEAIRNVLVYLEESGIRGGDIHDELCDSLELLEKREVKIVNTYSGDEMATAMEKLVNIMGNGDEIAIFIERMAGNHPTLQQAFMRLCLGFIRAMAEKSYSDARNEASVRIAKAITGQQSDGMYLPTI
jgi:hypothetical protein